MRNSLKVAEYIEELLKINNMKPAEFAKSIGVDRSTITRYLNGSRKISMDDLPKMAEVLGVSPIDLLIDKSEDSQNEITSTKLPLYGSVAAGALSTVDGITPDNVDYISIPSTFLGRYNNCSELFAMKVNGDSMNKIIKNGSIVVAKPQELQNYCDGDIVIFSYNNEYSLKRFAPKDLDGYVLFKAESKDPTFKDIVVPTNTTNDVKIYGKVIFYGTTL